MTLIDQSDPGAALSPEDRAGALAERLLGATVAFFDLASVHLGHRLGLYRALHEGGPATSVELAGRTGTDERYVREWLEQQAVTGILAVEDVTAAPLERRFSLPEGHELALVAAEDPNFVVGLARTAVGCLAPIDQLVEAFATGAGVPYPDYGDDTRIGIAETNRPMFVNDLAREWLPALPDVHRRLQAGPAHVADLACGEGWSTIALARAYPQARIDGYDADEASIAAAIRKAADEGVADRVRFAVRDVSTDEITGRYDLVTIFEAVHDMSHPVEALRAARRLVGEGGTLLVADERAAERFAVPGDELERLLYGFSVLHCLPVGREDHHAAATGTVMRPDTLRQYAAEAGFAHVEVLPVDNLFWRFYRLDG